MKLRNMSEKNINCLLAISKHVQERDRQVGTRRSTHTVRSQRYLPRLVSLLRRVQFGERRVRIGRDGVGRVAGQCACAADVTAVLRGDADSQRARGALILRGQRAECQQADTAADRGGGRGVRGRRLVGLRTS